MRRRGGVGQVGAHFPRPVAQRDPLVESAAGEAADVGGLVVGDVNAVLGHGRHGEWVHRGGGGAQAPPELRQALRTVDHHVDDYINHARLKPAA
jgi:hypothetical protein